MTGNIKGLSIGSGEVESVMDDLVCRSKKDLSDAGTADKAVEKEITDYTVRSVRTKVHTDHIVQENYQEQSRAAQEAEAETAQITDQLEWIGTNVTEEDVEELNEEGSPYEEYTSAQLERALTRIKEQRRVQGESLERQVQKKKLRREQIQKIGLTDDKQRLAERLAAAGMPVTEANLEKLTAALGQAEQTVGRMDGKSVRFLMKNGYESSISRLYQASFVNEKSMASGGQNVSGVGAAQGMSAGNADINGGTASSDDIWQQIEPQARNILERDGVPVNEETMAAAKWLFQAELPIDGANIAKLQSLTELEELDSLPENTADRIAQTMASGQEAADTILGDATERQAEFAVTKWERLDINRIEDVTARRKTEEIRLKMTVEVAVRLLEKGIRLDTENLNQVVEGLKELEDAWYKGMLAEQGADTADSPQTAGGRVNDTSGAVQNGQSPVEIFRQTMEARQTAMEFSAYALGSVYRASGQITFRAFCEDSMPAAAAGQTGSSAGTNGIPAGGLGQNSSRVRSARAESAYEAGATEVRRDLGDSMRKAFDSVDSLLRSLELEESAANERAVRILGYNQIPVTEESVEQMKYYDSRVNGTLQEMKPAVVVRMIRNGQNPLDMTMEELGDTVRELSDELQPAEESYSRYLWKLEKHDGITAEERSAYIGIYRLLHQIEKSDGAAIGAVVETGQELTLRNLLTAVRTKRTGGIDRTAGDTVREVSAEPADRARRTNGAPAGNQTGSITEQIMLGYLKENARQVRHELERPEEDYLSHQTEVLREQAAADADMVRFLHNYGMESTPERLEAAKELLGAAIGAGSSRRGKLLATLSENAGSEVREELKQESEDVLSVVDEPEEFRESLGKLQETIRKSLRAEEGAEDLTFDRLQELRRLGRMMNLSEGLARQEHYEIPLFHEDGSLSRISLTVRHEGGRKGQLELTAETGDGEVVRGDFRLRGGALEGYFRCDSRESKERTEGVLAGLRNTLEAAGFECGSLTSHLTGSGTSRITTAPAGAGRMTDGGAQTGEQSAAGAGMQTDTAGTAGTETSGSQVKRLYEAAKLIIDTLRG